jgi:THUMP domain-like
MRSLPLSFSTDPYRPLGSRDAVTVCNEIADYEWLTGDEAAGLLNELMETIAPLHAVVGRLRRQLSPERTHLLVEQVELRRRAAAKFTQAHCMFFTRIGLEQATDERVAAHKAARFIGLRAGVSPPRAPTAVADLCCGIGGDLLALAEHANALGIDRSPVAAHIAAANTGVRIHRQDVTESNLSDFDAWHIDPDRRPDGRRTTSIEFCQPNLEIIERLLARAPHAAVKLAPATTVPGAWAERCELEWISRNRECRQLVAWHGELALLPGQRRATVLPGAAASAGGCASATSFRSESQAAQGEPETPAPRTVVGEPNVAVAIVDRVEQYVFDVDAAVLAAHLKGALAAEQGLHALGAGSTYLTGPRAVDDFALSCFEVVDVLPLEMRKLADYLREHRVGQLEIKKRGVEIEPEKLRRELKLRGDNAATLLVTPVAGRHAAIVAQRVLSTPTRQR